MASAEVVHPLSLTKTGGHAAPRPVSPSSFTGGPRAAPFVLPHAPLPLKCSSVGTATAAPRLRLVVPTVPSARDPAPPSDTHMAVDAPAPRSGGSRKRAHRTTGADAQPAAPEGQEGGGGGGDGATSSKKRPRHQQDQAVQACGKVAGVLAAAARPATRPRPTVMLVSPVVSFDAPPIPFISEAAERCLVLDNDETTGAYQLGSLLFSMYMSLCASPPPHQVFIEEYLRRGGLRPGVVHLLRSAAALKQAGRLDHIVIFTAASNRNGWVTFLRDCLEQLAGLAPGTISRVITMEHCAKRNPFGRVIKDLRLVCRDTTNVVMVDDKPEYVQHGRVIRVAEYTQHTPIDALVESMPCSEQHRRIARQALVDDAATHAPCTDDMSCDDQMSHVARLVEELFP